jgi:hypothetical protein
MFEAANPEFLPELGVSFCAVSVLGAHEEAGVLLLDRPGRREAAGFDAADTLNRGVCLMLSVIQWRYGSASSHQRRLPGDLDIFSLFLWRPFRPLHTFQIQTSVVGRRPHRRCGSYWRRIGLPTFRWTSPSSLFVRCHHRQSSSALRFFGFLTLTQCGE